MPEIRTASHISELSIADWDRLVGQRAFAAHRWFRFLEGAAQPYTPRYLMLYQEGAPIAGAVYLLRRQEDIPLPRPLRGLLERYILRHPLLSCQTFLFSRPALFLPPCSDATNAVRELIAATGDLAQSEHCSFVTYDYLPAGAELAVLQHAGLGSIAYASEPGAFLALPGSNSAGYLHTLKRDRRQNLTRLMRRAEGSGVHTEVTRDLARARERVAQLVQQVYARHQEHGLPAPEALIKSAAENIPDDTWLVLSYLGSELAGCCFVLRDGEEAAMRVLGLDYDLDTHGHVYRSVLIEAVRFCAEHGIRRVDGGSTAYTFKDRLGFRLEHTAVAFTSPNPLLRHLGNLVVRLAT